MEVVATESCDRRDEEEHADTVQIQAAMVVRWNERYRADEDDQDDK